MAVCIANGDFGYRFDFGLCTVEIGDRKIDKAKVKIAGEKSIYQGNVYEKKFIYDQFVYVLLELPDLGTILEDVTLLKLNGVQISIKNHNGVVWASTTREVKEIFDDPAELCILCDEPNPFKKGFDEFVIL